MKKQRIYLILVLILLALSVVLVLDKKSGTMKRKAMNLRLVILPMLPAYFLPTKGITLLSSIRFPEAGD